MNKENVGLYDQSFEHDNCGIGAVVNIKGLKTYKTVDDALTIRTSCWKGCSRGNWRWCRNLNTNTR